MDVLNHLREALGSHPSSFVQRGYAAKHSHLTRLIEARKTSSFPEYRVSHKPEIWPLISHHVFNRYNPFGLTKDGNLKKRALLPLLAHHGLVASDPLIEVERLWLAHRQEESLDRFNTVIKQFAQVEPLVVRGLMRFETYRPAFSENARRSVLNAFNVDDRFSNFTYLLEAYDAARHADRPFEIAYGQSVYELYEQTGLECPDLKTALDAYQAVKELGEALIQVSWQFAVCSYNPTCDITIAGGLERQLFNALVTQWKTSPSSEQIDRQLQKTRHYERLMLGHLPNVDSLQLSVEDAVKLRKHRIFEDFRSVLAEALDDYATQLDKGRQGAASESFADAMRIASRRLQNQARQNPGRTFLSGAIPTAITAASTFVPQNLVEPHWLSLPTGAAAVVAAWAVGQSKAKGHKVAVRYCVQLGGTA